MERESSAAGQSLGPNAGRVAGSGSQQQPAAVLSADVAAGVPAGSGDRRPPRSPAAMHSPAAASYAFQLSPSRLHRRRCRSDRRGRILRCSHCESRLEHGFDGRRLRQQPYTLVAARVPGQVLRDGVLVDDNYRVRKGDVLVRLDPQPYQIVVDEKRAAYDLAKANLVVAQDEFRGLISKARSARFQLDHAIEDVDNQVALLRSNVAKLGKADADYKRAITLQKTPGVISEQDIDQYKAAYLVALEQVYQNRVGLGLPMKPEHGDLSEVPANLDQTYSTAPPLHVLYQAAAPVEVVNKSFNYTPRQLIDAFYSLDPSHNVDVIYAHLTENAPSIKLAEANMQQARADLDQAKLNLSYCTVYAEIDGVVANPVQPRQ